MLNFYTRVLMIMAAAASCTVPTTAAPFEITPRDTLSAGDDYLSTRGDLIFYRRDDFGLEGRKLQAHQPGTLSDILTGIWSAIPFTSDDNDGDTPDAVTTTTSVVTKPSPTQDTRSRPSSTTPILPRMFSFDVNDRKWSKRRLTPTIESKSTTPHPSATSSAMSRVDSLVGSHGKGIVLE